MIRFALALVRRYSSFYYYFLRRIPAGVAGIVVGICVVLFRVCLDWVMQGSFSYDRIIFILRYPVFFYYFIYGSLFFTL